jgi:hypothetical protein
VFRGSFPKRLLEIEDASLLRSENLDLPPHPQSSKQSERPIQAGMNFLTVPHPKGTTSGGKAPSEHPIIFP